MSRAVKLVLALGILFVLLIAATASARGPVALGRPWPGPRQTFVVSLIGGHGGRLQTFQHRGQTWVLGRPGERFAIRIQNPTARRVEAVVSVDGRDAVSGTVADFVGQRGYVIEPFGSVEIEGFRTSLDDVATFRFSDPEASYASRRGTPENVGVIGVAFFPERERREQAIAKRDGRRSRTAPSGAPSAAETGSARAGSARAAKPKAFDRAFDDDGAGNLGTEFGESRQSSVVQVRFVRDNPSRPAQIVTLRYDDFEGLEARGIDVRGDGRLVRGVRDPEPFPRTQFAPAPN